MAIDIATFRARFPEFSDDTEYPDPRVQLFIDDSLIYIGTDEDRWGLKYNLAQSYITAHMLLVATKSELGDSSSQVGPVQSKSAGGVSVTKAVVAKDLSSGDEYYMSTTYGQQFILLRNICFVGVLTANRL